MPGYDIAAGLTGWTLPAYAAGLGVMMLVGWLYTRKRDK